MSALEDIRFRANLECEDERDYLHAEEDRDRLLAALDAVLALADDLISDITGADGVENEAQDEIRDQIAGHIRTAVNDALEGK